MTQVEPTRVQRRTSPRIQPGGLQWTRHSRGETKAELKAETTAADAEDLPAIR